MTTFHGNIHSKWSKMSIYEQMANVGAEVGRAITWRNKNNEEISRNAFYRALELIDTTVFVTTKKSSIKELLRLREILVDYFAGENIYNSTDEWLNKYFYYYNFAANKDR